jgi:hypothetical protein
MIALDSNAMTYWIDAMSSVQGLPSNPCSSEKLALVRIFFWMPQECCFHYTPAIEAEYHAIKDQAKPDDHLDWVLKMVSPVRPLPGPAVVEQRTSELLRHHKGEKDCRIVAESELTEIITLLACDGDLLKNLRDKTSIQIRRLSEYWKQMGVPRGTRSTLASHETILSRNAHAGIGSMGGLSCGTRQN